MRGISVFLYSIRQGLKSMREKQDVYNRVHQYDGGVPVFIWHVLFYCWKFQSYDQRSGEFRRTYGIL